jgi:hypothetical protein
VKGISGVREQNVADFEHRRKGGWGSFRDSTVISKRGTLSAVFAEVPSVTVRTARGAGGPHIYLPGTAGRSCLAVMYVDHVKQPDHSILLTLRPDDIAAIEVYARRTLVPAEFQTSFMPCGAVIIWTKAAWR